MSTTAYLSLGSNVGDREANLRVAIERLSEVGRVTLVSSLYETEPVEVTDQPWFLNCAVAMETERSATELLQDVLAIERSMGRERTRPKGPRNIDIDILLFGGEEIEVPGLSIPHPGMADRLFVLEPLAEIAPQVEHPLLGKSVVEMRNTLRAAAPVVRRYSRK